MVIFKALACDDDGTLASEDRVGEDALSALEKARETGLRLLVIDELIAVRYWSEEP